MNSHSHETNGVCNESERPSRRFTSRVCVIFPTFPGKKTKLKTKINVILIRVRCSLCRQIGWRRAQLSCQDQLHGKKTSPQKQRTARHSRQMSQGKSTETPG